VGALSLSLGFIEPFGRCRRQINTNWWVYKWIDYWDVTFPFLAAVKMPTTHSKLLGNEVRSTEEDRSEQESLMWICRPFHK